LDIGIGETLATTIKAFVLNSNTFSSKNRSFTTRITRLELKAGQLSIVVLMSLATKILKENDRMFSMPLQLSAAEIIKFEQ